jgi:LmbE family N-acetylglucosaminyl deacetylase
MVSSSEVSGDRALSARSSSAPTAWRTAPMVRRHSGVAEPLRSKVMASTGDKVLVVTAHPDDVDFGSGGTVATWTAEGADVVYCIVTNGAAGAADSDVDLADLVGRRQSEQRKAAAEVGVSDVRFLGYPDGRLAVTYELRRDLSRVIREVRPGRVLCQSPERNWERIRASHPDHLAAGEATLQAVYPDARNPYAHPELLAAGLEPHEVGEVWLMASPRADRYVEITAVIERKLAALACHESQIADPKQLEEIVRRWTQATAERAGLGAGRYAEAFQVVDTH